MNIKQQTIHGTLWALSQQFGAQLINFIVQLVLARVLLPAEFGLIAMLTVFIGIGNSLMDSGLTSSLIRTTDANQKDYSTIFFVNLLGSVCVYLILFFSAPLIASFYKQEILTTIIRVYTLSFVIQAFIGVQNARLVKEMKFKTQMAMQIPSVIIGGCAGIVLAYLKYGVWSLVWMNLIQSFLFAIQHWIRSGWYPDFIIDKERLKHHFQFGYKLTISGILNVIFNNAYNLVIGKYFSAIQLGFYNRADAIRSFPVYNISAALNKITYPVFAKMQADNNALKSVYKRITLQVIFWITPLMILLIITAEPLFRFLLTEKWLPSVPYFQLLCIVSILYPLQVYNLNILNVKGRSDLFLRLEIIKKVIIAVGILCSLPFGIYGLLYFQIIFSFIAFYINAYFTGRMINYPIKEQLLDILPSILLAIVVGGVSWLFDYFQSKIFNAVDIFRVISSGLCYFILYVGTSFLLRMPAIIDFRNLILKK